MSDEQEEVVKVLYDYTYNDDGGQVEIKTGDIYRLIEKTNSEWWQVYDPSDYDGESFFVPAQYVEIVAEKSPWKALSDLDKVLTFGEDSNESSVKDYVHTNDNDEDLYSRTRDFTHQRDLVQPGSISGNSNYVNFSSQPQRTRDDGEYVNLDEYRENAGIPNMATGAASAATRPSNLPSTLTKPPTVPQELIQGTIPPPLPEEGTYVKVLVKGMPWDIYKETTLGRLYYVNRDTGERMWKPPRKEKPSPDQPQVKIEKVHSPTTAPSPLARDEEWSGIPPEYEQVHENGNVYFIHKSTKEKWKSLVDKLGRQYFHKHGSNDTKWKLPSTSSEAPEKDMVSNTSDTSVQIKPRLRPKDVNWESQGHRLSTFGGQSMRATKTMSTYGQLETSIANRSSTLPANFMAARPAPVANERSHSPTVNHPNSQRSGNLTPSSSTGTLQQPEELFGGYLNKTKIADVNKKKVKKNWTHIYVVLQGSNLVFYKDQKAAAQKPGSPHGRPEGVVSLQGAHVDINLKEMTSRKNTICLRVSSGSIFLFQSESEKEIFEWFTKMKLVANDLSPQDPSPRDFDIPEKEKGMTRSISEDSQSLQGGDKSKNMVGIRAKLLNFISRRPTQEDLYKRGIIKDAVFGAKLHELCDREKVNVPKFIHKCIAAVESKGLTHDGMYRVSGNMAEIQRLRCAVDKDDTYDLYDEQWDIHVLTGALKLFFRELKEPVFPFHMYNKFIDAIKKESRKEKLSAFKSAVHDLPRCNYMTLKEVFQHLRKVSEQSHKNRMQVQNIAIVFGPTLMWQEEEAGSLAVQTVFQSKIVEFMLLEYPELFLK